MSKYTNSRKDNFLSKVIVSSFESSTDPINQKCKFNFSYIDFSQPAGQSFSDLSKSDLEKLLNKLLEFSKSSLKYWQNQRVGGGGLKVLEVYDKFPQKSEFSHPPHVPHQALWARFRLEAKSRLIGFVIPNEYRDQNQIGAEFQFDCNTFYVVFLDANHVFYKTESS
jgi:hypothetical protein